MAGTTTRFAIYTTELASLHPRSERTNGRDSIPLQPKSRLNPTTSFPRMREPICHSTVIPAIAGTHPSFPTVIPYVIPHRHVIP